VISDSDGAIGGYFQLETSQGNGLAWSRDAFAFQSARSALAAVLGVAQPATIWAPNYICGVVNETLSTIGVPVRRYSLTENLGVPAEVDPGPEDWVICVDYFGLCKPVVEEAIHRFGPRRVLVDASQSLYFNASSSSTVIYSPRKFVGVPDGGFALTPLRIPPTLEADEAASQIRCRHLETRSSGAVEAGYVQFQEAEASLAGCLPLGMSNWTRNMLASIDFEAVRICRIENYHTLTSALAEYGFRTLPMPLGMVPLCVPILDVDVQTLRQKLLQNRIFSPSYWVDAVIPETDKVAARLRDNTLYLPCDQRYGNYAIQKTLRALID
jgi:hypothetical protein